MGGEDVVRYIQPQRIRWMGHVPRTGEQKAIYIYIIIKWKPDTGRKRERP